jgi:hypothetical protein
LAGIQFTGKSGPYRGEPICRDGASIDEAACLKDKVQKLEYYARIRDDKATETHFSEIKLRAVIKIGELSRELEKSKGGANPKVTLPIGGKSKSESLADGGIAISTVVRYEQLAGPRDAQAQEAVQGSNGKLSGQVT